MKRSIIKELRDRKAHQQDVASEPQGSEPASGDAPSSQVISNSTPVVNMGKALSQIANERIVSLDPEKIDKSPFQDRLESDDEFELAIEELKSSIKSEGQKIPILVRPHPDKAGRFQLAYGFRRLESIKRINAEAAPSDRIKVRAYVRKLDDLSLAKEQSLENGVRENLSWIEQALWAQNLLALGFQQKDICPIIGKSKSAVSMLVRISGAVPKDLILAIGRAKGSGRPKWSKLADLLQDPAALKRAGGILSTEKFLSADSNTRLSLVIKAASPKSTLKEAPVKTEISSNGQVLAVAKQSAKGITVAVSDKSFAEWLMNELPTIVQKFEEQQ